MVLLRAGQDIWYLLRAAPGMRYLVVLVLLMLWARIVLIVIESLIGSRKQN